MLYIFSVFFLNSLLIEYLQTPPYLFIVTAYVISRKISATIQAMGLDRHTPVNPIYFTRIKAVTDLPASSVTPAMVVTADFPIP